MDGKQEVPDNPMEPIISPSQTWGVESWYEPAEQSEVPFAPLPPLAGSSLSEYQKEFVFFTPALLYLYGGFTNNILQDFVAQYEQGSSFTVAFFAYQAKQPIFQGLEIKADMSWNYYLFGVRRIHWLAFESFMLSLALVNKDLLIRVGLQEIEIADPMLLGRYSVVPTNPPLVTVIGFGVNSTEGAVAFEPGDHPLLDPPKIAFHEPQNDHLVFVKAMRQGENPHDAVAKWRMERGNKNSDA